VSLKKLKITNEIEYLKKLHDLSRLNVESKIIEKNGSSVAQAKAEKQATIIESVSKVKLAEMSKKAKEIELEYAVRKIKKENSNDYLSQSEEQRLSIKNIEQNNAIESNKFKNIIEALSPETLVEMAKAGPELQAKLLQGLNLSGYILTDGNNPISLFNVANNLVKSD